MKIDVIPVGNVNENILKVLIEELSSSLKHKFVLRPSIKPPEDAFNKFRGQYLAERILDVLREKGKVLGVTEEDIYANGLNFVFGEAEFEGPCLISTARLKNEFYKGKPNFQLLASRMVKEAVHELGHVFGLKHCMYPE